MSTPHGSEKCAMDPAPPGQQLPNLVPSIRPRPTDSAEHPGKRHRRAPPSTPLSSLPQECFVLILSYLSAHDLGGAAARVCQEWWRISRDPSLWRRLYLSVFASDGRRSTSGLLQTRPWRELYKISANWRRGSARPSVLGLSAGRGLVGQAVREAVLEPAPINLTVVEDEVAPEPAKRDVVSPAPRDLDILVQVHHQHLFTASRGHVTNPFVAVSYLKRTGEAVVLGHLVSRAHRSLAPDERISITALCLDEVSPLVERPRPDPDRVTPVQQLRIAVFYSTGQWAIFELAVASPSTRTPFSSTATEIFTSTRPPGIADPVHLARLHFPLLVTCSRGFEMRFYTLRVPKGGEIRVREVMGRWKSPETWSPVVLNLATILHSAPHDDAAEHRDRAPVPRLIGFHVILAYSTPVFPNLWSVGVNDFHVSLPSGSSTVPSISLRHAVAPVSYHHYAWPSHRSPPRISTPDRHGPGSGLVTGIEYDAPYIVTSRSDNTIQVYQILPSSDAAPPSRLRVVHSRTLFGHMCAVNSVAIVGGKCVSGAADGSVKVWDLDESPGLGLPATGLDVVEEAAQVTDALVATESRWVDPSRIQVGLRVKQIFLDEEKIVSIVQTNNLGDEDVRVLRFD